MGGEIAINLHKLKQIAFINSENWFLAIPERKIILTILKGT
jgi:hypothetical protein